MAYIFLTPYIILTAYILFYLTVVMVTDFYFQLPAVMHINGL